MSDSAERLAAILDEQLQKYPPEEQQRMMSALEKRTEAALNIKWCRRCDHTWVAKVDEPVRCPKCRNPRWQTSPRSSSSRYVANRGTCE